jgi:hypothetical protein
MTDSLKGLLAKHEVWISIRLIFRQVKTLLGAAMCQKKRFGISIKIRSYSFSVAFSKAALPSEANSQTPPSEKAFPED